MAASDSSKELYRRWIDEAWSKGNVDVLDDMNTPDFADHSGLLICTNVINPPPGRTGWPDYGQNLPAGPPDLEQEIAHNG